MPEQNDTHRVNVNEIRLDVMSSTGINKNKKKNQHETLKMIIFQTAHLLV